MTKLISLLIFSAVIFTGTAQCPQVLDQSQTTFDTGDQGTDQWQSFIPAINGKLTQVNFYLNGIQTVNITLEVRTGTGTGGALLYSNVYNYSSAVNEQAMVIPFGSAPTLAAGSTYTIRFVSGSNFYTLKTSGSSYANGIHYSAYGTVGEAWFKTFMTPTNAPTISIASQTAPSCFNGFDGSITTSGSGGNGGNTYLWSPSGGTGSNASGLPSDTYTVTVTDMLGCTAQASATLSNPLQVTMTDPPDQVICAGSNTTATSFSGALSYNWTNDQPGIGIPASGSGNIGSFTAINSGATPIVATITIIPVGVLCVGAQETFTYTINPAPASNDPADQNICAGTNTTPVVFTGPVAGTLFSWSNSNTSVGLAGSGTGDISPFTSINAGTATQTATITVTPSANGCTGPSQTMNIFVNPIPSVVDPTDQTICANNLSAAVNFSGPVAGTNYSWTNTNTTIGLTSSGMGNIPAFTALNPGSTANTGTITVTPTYAGVCTGASQNFYISVNPTPTISAATDQTLCNGDASGLVTFSGTVAGTLFNWVNSNSSIGLSPSGTGDIGSFVTVNGGSTNQIASVSITPTANGCNGTSDVFTYTIYPTPTVIDPVDQTVCANDFTTAVVFSGAVAGTNFDWTNSNTATGLNASGSGNIAAFSAINAGGSAISSNVTVTPEASGCYGTAALFTLLVNPLPPVGFSAIADFCDNDLPYTLTEGTPFGGTYSGTGVTGGNFSPSIAGGGTHTATYTFTDVNGCSSFANQSILVHVSPAVNFTAVPDFCADALPYSLTEGTPGGGIYAGPGISGSVFNSTTAGAGIHNVTYSYTDGNNCTNSAAQNITVNASPVMNFPALSSVCISLAPFSLTSATPAGGTYTGPGVTGGIFDPAAAGIGTHVITYTYTDGVTFCTNQIQQNITVYNTPAIVANATATSLCNGSSLTLFGSGGTSYIWDNGVIDNTAFIPASGTITYTVTGDDINGCQATDQIIVTVYDLPIVSGGVNQTICEAVSVTLNGSGAQTYIWDNGVTDGVAFTPVTTTTYTVTGTDINNCQNAATVTITVDPVPALSVSADQVFCQGDAVTLTASGASNYDWNSGASSSSSYTFNPAETMTVPVTGTSGICSASAIVVLTLDDPALVSAGTDAVVCLGFITYLNASGGVNYTWNGPGLVNITEANHGFIVDTTAYYYLTAETENGCVYADSVLITSSMDASCSIEPLTTFSPNGDAVNENWKIQGIESFPDNHVTILNRWGDVVFDQINYNNETVLWLGTTQNGSEAPAGTYYFIVEITNGPAKTGWIQLLK